MGDCSIEECYRLLEQFREQCSAVKSSDAQAEAVIDAALTCPAATEADLRAALMAVKIHLQFHRLNVLVAEEDINRWLPASSAA